MISSASVDDSNINDKENLSRIKYTHLFLTPKNQKTNLLFQLPEKIKNTISSINESHKLVISSSMEEAIGNLASYNFELIITDSTKFHEQVEESRIKKILLKDEFFSTPDDPEYNIQPLHYIPNSNTILLRTVSAHNQRFLLKIFDILLNPINIKITFLGVNEHKKIKEDIFHTFSYFFKNVHFSIFNSIELIEIKDVNLHENFEIEESLYFLVDIESNVFSLKIKTLTSNKKSLLTAIYEINEKIKKIKGISFYNNLTELAIIYNNYLKENS